MAKIIQFPKKKFKIPMNEEETKRHEELSHMLENANTLWRVIKVRRKIKKFKEQVEKRYQIEQQNNPKKQK